MGDLGSIPGLGRSTGGQVFLPAEVPWTEDPGGLQSWDHKEKYMIEQLNTTAIFKVL